MLSLYELLFRKNYWRMLLRHATWQEAWTSVRRSHKDRRARKHLLQVLLLLLAPIACIAYAAAAIGTGAWVFVPFVFLVIWWRRRQASRDDQPIHIAPQPEPVIRALTANERNSLRSYFAELGLVSAIMVDRAGSERFLKQKVLPEGFEVTTRRIHIDRLKLTGLWERMAASDREAMMMPDGHWEWDLIHTVTLALEPLRLLRWILRVDYYLPTVGQQLIGDYSIAHQLAATPEKLLEGADLATSQMLETAQQAADIYFRRCIAEAISRGEYDPGNEEAVAWGKSVSKTLGGNQHEDLLISNRLVSEVSSEELLWAVSLSRRRRDFLLWVLRCINTAAVPGSEFPAFAPVPVPVVAAD